MRDKLNNDPMYQIGAVVVLLVLGFVIFTRVAGGGSEAESVPDEAGVAVEGAVEPAPESPAPVESVASSVAGVTPPPLPHPVEAAYQGGKTVVLLVAHDGGIDDRLVADSTRRLESFPNTAVFIVPPKQIARYGAITLGVEVAQVPALVVVKPKQVSGGVPQASVTYGFQTREGIAQAMRDASYDGPESTYYPR